MLENWRASEPLPGHVTAHRLADAEAEIAATCAPVDDPTLAAVLARLLDFGARWDLIGSPHRLRRDAGEADDGGERAVAAWVTDARADLRQALAGLPAAAVLAGVEALLATWRYPRLPLPGDVRAATESLPAWTETRAALLRIQTARWALRKASR